MDKSTKNRKQWRTSFSGQSPGSIPDDDAREEKRAPIEENWDKSDCETGPSKDTVSWSDQILQEELECERTMAKNEEIYHREDDGSFSKKNYTRRSEPFRNDRNEDRRSDKRLSLNEKGGNWRGRDSSNGRRKSRWDPTEDPEFLEYKNACHSWKGEVVERKTREITSDLFEAPNDYSLAHCVAEDMNMGSGIAVAFRYKFKRVGELLNQHEKTGGLAILDDENRYIYYLVTKKYSSGKPTYATLFSSLKRLREHVVAKGVERMAMPRIGCGLDRLDWTEVKLMIEFVFRNVDIEITVCNLEHTEDPVAQKHKNCKVTHETYPIEKIEAETVVLYFSSEDEEVSEEMKKLDEKFHFLQEFKYAKKTKGGVVVFGRNPKYLICGCIVKKNRSDRFDFVALQKCLSQIQKENKKTGFYYYAFQAIRDKRDFCINYKIINILRNSLRDVEVYVCWPGDLADEMTPRDRFGDEYKTNTSAKDHGWRRKNDDHEREDKASREAHTERDERPARPSFVEDAPKKTDGCGGYTDHFSSQEDAPKETDGYRRDTDHSSPQASREAHTERDERLARPSFVDHSTTGASDSNDSFPINTSAEDNSTESNSDWFSAPSTGTETATGNAVNPEHESFLLDYKTGKIDTSKLKEQTNPQLPKQYSRVCFASEDLIIDGGIPPGDEIGPIIGKLLKKQGKEGGLVSYPGRSGVLCCLIISRAYGQASSYSVFCSMQKLRELVTKNRVQNLVIPVVDKLGDVTWKEVKAMIGYLLGDKQITIVLAPFETNYSLSSLEKQNRVKLNHTKAGVHQTPKKSFILYVASADGRFTEEMSCLEKKFVDFGDNFKKAKKVLGDVVRHKENEDYVVYGCVVKTTACDCIDFEEFRKCLLEVKRQNGKEKLQVVGIQAVKDPEEGVNLKILTLLLHCLEDVKIRFCWPGELKDLMPVR